MSRYSALSLFFAACESFMIISFGVFELRHTVRPGITGWAQVKYQYGASVEESKTKLEYDFFYIKHMSIVLDLAILFETAKVMIYGRGAK